MCPTPVNMHILFHRMKPRNYKNIPFHGEMQEYIKQIWAFGWPKHWICRYHFHRCIRCFVVIMCFGVDRDNAKPKTTEPHNANNVTMLLLRTPLESHTCTISRSVSTSSDGKKIAIYFTDMSGHSSKQRRCVYSNNNISVPASWTRQNTTLEGLSI